MTGFLLENFDKIAEAPGGVQQLRELILQLAVTGRLGTNNKNDKKFDLKLAENDQIVTGKNERKKSSSDCVDSGWDKESLPSNWIIIRLNNISEILRGVSFPKSEASVDKKSDYSVVLRSNNIGQKLNLNALLFIPDSYISDQQRIRLNDFIIAMSSGSQNLVGKVSLIKTPINGCVGAFCGIIRCNSNIEIEYLNIYFQNPIYRKKISSFGKGIGINNLSKTSLEKLYIPIPPLAEQKRIVEKVDSLMAICDELEAKQTQKHTHLVRLGTGSLTTLQQSDTPGGLVQWWEHLQTHFGLIFDCVENVEALRQTILQLAVTGRLGTGDERDEPVIQLIRQIIDEKGQLVKSGIIGRTKDVPVITDTETPYNIPNNWQWIRLDHISYISTGSTPSTTNPDYYYNGVIPWVTSSQTSMSKIYAADKKITQKAVDDCSLKIYPIGTLLVALYGQGKTRGQVSELKIESTINQACAAICFFEKSKSISSYIKIFLKGNYNSIRSISAGGAQPNLNLDKIKRMHIPLPPLAEQQRILEKVDTLMALCDQLEHNIDHRSTKSISLSNATIQRITGLT